MLIPSHPKTMPTFQSPLFNLNVSTLPPQDHAPFPVPTVLMSIPSHPKTFSSPHCLISMLIPSHPKTLPHFQSSLFNFNTLPPQDLFQSPLFNFDVTTLPSQNCAPFAVPTVLMSIVYPPTTRPCPLSSPHCLISMVNTLPLQDLAPFPVLTV